MERLPTRRPEAAAHVDRPRVHGLRGAFATPQAARDRAASVLAEHEHDVAEWARDTARPRRLALRSTFAEDVGVLSEPAMLAPLPVADVVVLLELGGPDVTAGHGKVEFLAAFPEQTPGWVLAAAAVDEVVVADGQSARVLGHPPYPRLEQVCLGWLGQEWAREGAADAAAAVAGWRATAGTVERAAVRAEAEDLLGTGVDPRDLRSALRELGVALPEPEPGQLLRLLVAGPGEDRG